MKAMSDPPLPPAPRDRFWPSERSAGVFPEGLRCTVCGEARPLALVAYDAACRIVAICDRCVLRPETLRDVASLVARPHA